MNSRSYTTMQHMLLAILLVGLNSNNNSINTVIAQVSSCNFCVDPKVVTKPDAFVTSDLLSLLGIDDIITCSELDNVLTLGFTLPRICTIFQAAAEIKANCGCATAPTPAPTPKPTKGAKQMGSGKISKTSAPKILPSPTAPTGTTSPTSAPVTAAPIVPLAPATTAPIVPTPQPTKGGKKMGGKAPQTFEPTPSMIPVAPSPVILPSPTDNSNTGGMMGDKMKKRT